MVSRATPTVIRIVVPPNGKGNPQNGRTDSIQLKHTLNQEQIAWFKAGSALNKLRDEVSRR